MPLFRVVYCLSGGREIVERLQGPSRELVRTTLRQRGFFPIAIEEVGTPAHKRRLRIKLKTLARLLHQLDMQLRAGVDEITAIATLKDSHSSPKVRAMLSEVHASLSIARVSFSDAIGAYPRVIPPHLRSIIAAGEGHGPEHTADRLNDVRDWLLFTAKIRRTIRKATSYPTFLILLASSYLTFFVVWFIPKFKVLLKGFNMPMPAYTQAIISGSDWVRAHGLWLGAALAAAVVAAVFLRRLEPVAAATDRFILRLPFYSKIYQAIVTSQFTRNYRALVASGAPAGEALALCSEMFANRAARAEIRRLRREVVYDGAMLGTALRRCGYFPPEAVSIITTAEQTGNLGPALRQISEEYEEIAREAVESALGFIAPLLVVCTAAIVGAVLLGLFLPMSKIFENLH